MIAGFDLGSLKPFLIVGIAVIAALVKAFGKPKHPFDRPWESETLPERSEGHKVLGRLPRAEGRRPPSPPPLLPVPPRWDPTRDPMRDAGDALRETRVETVPPPLPRHPRGLVRPPIYADPAINESADIESAPAPSQELATLAPADDAYALAACLETRVAAHLREVDEGIANASPDHVRERSGGRSAEMEQVLALLRQPKTARQAVMATVILGPPRALEG